MNGSQTLRTAFWSLTVSLGLLLLLAGLRPAVTKTVTAFCRAPGRLGADESRYNGSVAHERISRQADDKRYLAATRVDLPQQASEQFVDRSTRVAVVAAPRVSVSRPVGKRRQMSAVVEPAVSGKSARGPWVQLGMIEDVADEPVGVPDAHRQPTPSLHRELNARLASLQTAIERLARAESDRRANKRELAAQQLKQTRQSQRLHELELQLQRLQIAAAAATTRNTTAAVNNTRPAVVTKQIEAGIETAADHEDERFSLQIRHTAVTEVLELLGQTTGYSIVVGEGVSGTVPSANLRDVTIVEALDGIIYSLGLVFEQDGRFIYVMTEAEHTARKLDTAKASAERDGSAVR